MFGDFLFGGGWFGQGTPDQAAAPAEFTGESANVAAPGISAAIGSTPIVIITSGGGSGGGNWIARRMRRRRLARFGDGQAAANPGQSIGRGQVIAGITGAGQARVGTAGRARAMGRMIPSAYGSAQMRGRNGIIKSAGRITFPDEDQALLSLVLLN